jgi:hypothetical protein
MSNWIDYDLAVLATSPFEINQIAERLKQPSTRQLNFMATESGQPVSQIIEGLKELVGFRAIRNLGYVDASVNKAREFSLSFKSNYRGVVDSHLFAISEDFPSAIFLLTFRDLQAGISGKKVIRAGIVVQHIHDGDHKSQMVDWVLLDIFAPFWAEYDEGLEFGSLWRPWLDDILATTKELMIPVALEPERPNR